MARAAAIGIYLYYCYSSLDKVPETGTIGKGILRDILLLINAQSPPWRIDLEGYQAKTFTPFYETLSEVLWRVSKHAQRDEVESGEEITRQIARAGKMPISVLEAVEPREKVMNVVANLCAGYSDLVSSIASRSKDIWKYLRAIIDVLERAHAMEYRESILALYRSLDSLNPSKKKVLLPVDFEHDPFAFADYPGCRRILEVLRKTLHRKSTDTTSESSDFCLGLEQAKAALQKRDDSNELVQPFDKALVYALLDDWSRIIAEERWLRQFEEKQS